MKDKEGERRAKEWIQFRFGVQSDTRSLLSRRFLIYAWRTRIELVSRFASLFISSNELQKRYSDRCELYAYCWKQLHRKRAHLSARCFKRNAVKECVVDCIVRSKNIFEDIFYFFNFHATSMHPSREYLSALGECVTATCVRVHHARLCDNCIGRN